LRLARIAIALACLACAPAPAWAQANAQADLDALIKAARAEGEVNFYSGVTENVAKRTGDAYSAKYGVKYSFIRLAGVQTERRFGAEAEAGTFAVDFYMVATAVPFAEDAIKKGWVESISQAGIPALREYPARFITPPTAIIQVAPWGIAYNTEKVKGADIPKDWPDLLNPKFKGQVLLPDPRSSNSYSDHWGIIIDKYGEDFLVKLREMNPRQYPSGVPSTNALGAGEGMVQAPAVAAQISATKDKGAPLGHVIPAYATGVEMQIVLTHRSKAKHPAAARLFAHFVMTPEGNKIFNSEPGSISVFDTVNLPKQYVSPKRDALARRELITKALGFPQ
jgi:iron(III) transport system substrate-binding protein